MKRKILPASSEPLRSVSIILPVMNETVSLEQTVAILLADIKDDIEELLIIVSSHTRRESMATVQRLQKAHGALVRVHQQTLPFLGGAMREAFALARGSHVVMMASDLETNPADVRRLVVAAKANPGSIITASRWCDGGGFRGYDPVKLCLNWAFQRVFGLLYWVRLTDLTYGFRIFPTQVVQCINWEDLRHPFLLETLAKPLRLGMTVTEIPCAWNARREGQPANTFCGSLGYLRTGVRDRFGRRRGMVATAASVDR
jgi:glycosyltransferase involved in cell wall biosynthesis